MDTTEIATPKINIPPDKPGYFISLDNIDLNLLSKLSRGERNAEVPLWDVQGPEYLEYMVYTRDVSGDTNDDGYENSTLQRCHICDVDVPTSYLEEHLSSTKHRICSTITEISLERAKRQMVPVTNVRQARDTTYFCQHCACAVNLTHKDTHINSKEHMISKTKDDLMNTFLFFYKDTNNYEKVCNDLKDILKVASDKKDFDGKIESATFNLKQYQTELNIYTDHKIEYIDDTKVRILTKSKAKLIVESDNFHGFSMSGEKILCRVCCTVVDDKEQHMNDITHLLKLCEVIEDKNCIRKLDSTLNHCILCNEVIENPEAHILISDKHGKVLKEALIDDTAELQNIMAKNYMSMSNFNKNVFFCDPCQLYFEKNDLTYHINKDIHRDAVLKFKPSRRKKNQSNHCDVCNFPLLGSKKQAKKHRNTPEHKYLAWLENKDKILHHHFQKAKFNVNVVCKICTTMIPNVKTTINEHLESSQHQSYYRDLLVKNKMEVVDEKTIKCHACGTDELVIEDLEHIIKRKHKKRVANYASVIQNANSNILFVKDNKNPVKLDTETQNAEYKESNSEEYLANASSTNTLVTYKNETTDEINDIITVNYIKPRANGLYACDPCKLTFKVDDLNDHINTETHKELLHVKFLKNNFDNNFCSICNVSVTLNQKGHHYSLEHRYQVYLRVCDKNGGYQFSCSDSVNKYNCRICNVDVDANGKSTLEHLKSVDHSERYQILTKENNLKKKGKKFVICQICNMTMLFFDELCHIRTKKHRKNLKESGIFDKMRNNFGVLNIYNPLLELNKTNSLEASYVNKETKQSVEKMEIKSDMCPVTTKSGLLSTNVEEEEHRVDLAMKVSNASYNDTNPTSSDAKQILINKKKKLHYVYEMNDLNFRCKICKTFVDFDNMSRHRNSNSHKQRFREELNANTMFRLYNVCFCECCMEIVELPLEYAHFTSEKHLVKLSSINNSSRMNNHKVREVAEAMFFKYDAAKKFNTMVEVPKTSTDNETLTDNDEKEVKTLSFTNSSYLLKENSNVEISSSDSDDTFISATSHINNSQLFNDEMTPKTVRNKMSNDDFNVLEDFDQSQYDFDHLFRKTKHTEEVICEICESAVPTRLITEHINDDKHYSNYKFLLRCNCIIEIDDLQSGNMESYYCKACNIEIIKTSFISHLTCQSHKTNIAITPSTSRATKWDFPFEVSTDSAANLTNEFNPIKIDTDSDKKDILNSDGTEESCKTSMTYLDLINKEKPYCKLCKIEFDEACIHQHLNGNGHKHNLKKIYEETIAPIDAYSFVPVIMKKPRNRDFFNCHLCNEQMFNVPHCINDHFNSETHKKIFEKLSAEEKAAYLSSDSGRQANLIAAVIDSTKFSQTKVKSSTSFTKSNSNKSSQSNSKISANNSQGSGTPTTASNTISSSRESISGLTTQTHNANGYKCSVCNVYVPNNPSNINDHNQGTRHSENVKKLAATTNDHIKEKGHQVNLKQLASNSYNKESVKHTHSEVCNMGSNNSPDSIIGLNQTVKKLAATNNNYKCNACNLNILNDPANINEHNQGDSHKKNDQKLANQQLLVANSYTCPVCNVKVPNNPNNINDHNQGERHKYNVKKLAASNNNYKCTVCKVNITNNPANINEHNQGDSHKKNVKKLANQQALASNSYTCPVCNVKVPNNPNNINDHNRGERHKENAKKLAASNNNYNCTVCKVNITNNPANINEHNQGDSHKKNVKKLANQQPLAANSYTCHVCNVNVPNNPNNINDHNQGEKHKDNVKKLAASNNNYKCTVCKVNITNNPANINEHNQGDSHKKNVKKLANQQPLAANSYTCPVCNVKVPNNPTNINDHNQSERHKENVKKVATSNNNYKCTVCKVNITNNPANINEHNQGKTYKENVNKQNAVVASTSNDTKIVTQQVIPNKVIRTTTDKDDVIVTNSYKCSVCNVCVPNRASNINEHNEGLRHKNNVIYLSNVNDNSKKDAGKKTSVDDAQTNKSNILLGSILKTVNNTPVTERDDTNVTNNMNVINNEPITSRTSHTTVTVSDGNKTKEETTDSTESEDEYIRTFYICKACGVRVRDDPNARRIHESTAKHTNNVKKKRDMLKENLEEKDLYSCDVCKIQLTNNSLLIKIHNDSKEHERILNKLLDANKIKARDDRICYCELCDLYFNKLSVTAHLARETHKNNIALNSA